MQLTKIEKETILLFNEAETKALVDTYNIALQNRLTELCEVYPEQAVKTRENAHDGMSFEIPKKWIKIVPPRALSPAQREVLDRMNENRRQD